MGRGSKRVVFYPSSSPFIPVHRRLKNSKDVAEQKINARRHHPSLLLPGMNGDERG
jgi:hypothetical protein